MIKVINNNDFKHILQYKHEENNSSFKNKKYFLYMIF